MDEKFINQSPLSKEQRKIQEDIEAVMATEGFSRLTKKQQQMIKMSLYAQVRAERKTKKTFWDKPVNRYSKKYVSDRNCHSSILSLEKENPKELPNKNVFTLDFFEAKYSPTETINELKKQIEEFGFPCVLHIADILGNNLKDMVHSCLVLGHDKNNNIILWEKEGDGTFPYRIITLDQVYYSHGSQYQYGLRKLRSNLV